MNKEKHIYKTTNTTASKIAEVRLQQAIKNASSADIPIYQVRKLGVLGAGMMGSGIAYEAARIGVDVVLKDISLEAAQKGKQYAEKVSSKLLEQGRLDEEKRQQLLACIYPTENPDDLKDCDMIIEAVFEDQKLKTDLIQAYLPYLNDNGFFASNTTSLPISNLAAVSPKPEDFIGMHFFSPVDRMPLVEIIKGKHTSNETLAKALGFVYRLDKVPIVVHDGPAFFTSRIFFNYLLEGITMLLEGIPLPVVEDNARKAGFVVGPLAVLDEISLSLMTHVYDQLPELHPSQQRAYNYLKKLIGQGRNGRRTGKGFYNYPKEGGKKEYWNDPELIPLSALPKEEDIQKRLLHVVALDSYRCLDTGILDRPIDGDIGSILGIGYAPQTGGVFSHIDQVGLKEFVKDCQRFAVHGEQWHLPPSLLSLAEKDFSFYSGLESNWKN